MKWFWGSLLILIGLVLLGTNLSIFSASDLVRLWQFWPVLIILYGLSLIARHWKLGWLVMLAAFWAGVLLVYNIAYSPTPVININQSQDGNIKTSDFSADVSSSYTKANINIEAGAVNLSLQDNTSKLIEGTLESSYATPDLSVKNLNDVATVDLKTKKSGIGIGQAKNNLDLRLTNLIPLAVKINSGASTLNLDFSKIKLSDLKIDSGASTINLKLGTEVDNNAEFKISAGASSIDISIPQSLGVKIINSSALSNKNFEGFSEVKTKNYQNINYDTASKKVTITINAAVSSMKVHTY